jgi:gamma-glutamylcyclotransferase (GGCT)/AIG2-like uncharacterized protein YtfP
MATDKGMVGTPQELEALLWLAHILAIDQPTDSPPAAPLWKTTTMLDRLFVYGSLMHVVGHEMGAKLAREADYLGPASTPGRLYRKSWYPVALDAASPADILHGAVYRLRTPETSLVWLDAYEGITQDGTSAVEQDNYFRAVRDVTLTDGTKLEAFIYLYHHEQPESARIPSGSWLIEKGLA